MAASSSTLISSTRSKIEFSCAVERKFEATANAYAKAGRIFQIPDSIRRSLIKMRVMHRRYAARNFFHTADEERAEKDVSEWIVSKHHELKGTTPPPNTWSRGCR